MPKCPSGAHDATFALTNEGAPPNCRLVVCTICNTAIGAVPIPQTEIAKNKVESVTGEMVKSIEELFTSKKKEG
jgi:hypothetical protein